MAQIDESTSDIAVIGAGPAGLMAAERLAAHGLRVTVFDAMATPGRKLLMAGRGGLNLTHSEPLAGFIARYGAAAKSLRPMIERFPPEALRQWADGLGAETFVGTSGRVFPKAMKASGLLRHWLRRLSAAGVEFRLRHRWTGFDGERLVFEGPDHDPLRVTTRATVLALGGASWPKLGSEAAWVPLLAARGIAIAPLRPANCGFDCGWSGHFSARAAGQPLKNVKLALGGEKVAGEVMITETGIEGGAVYAVSAVLRDALESAGRPVTLMLDLKPQMAEAEVTERLAARRKGRSLSAFLSGELKLAPVAYALLREVRDPLPDRPEAVAALIKHVPLPVERPRPIEEAISSAGGIRFDAVDDRLMLKAIPGVFVCGEMLDWEAPTGGYLLQGCMSTAVTAAEGVMQWLGVAG